MKDIENLILYTGKPKSKKTLGDFIKELYYTDIDIDVSPSLVGPSYGTRNRYIIHISDSDSEEEIVHIFYIKDKIDSIEEFKESFDSLVKRIKRSLMIDKLIDL